MVSKKRKSSAPRNPHAINPIMRKGGQHGKSRKAERRQAKQKIYTKWADLTVPMCV